MIRDKNLQDNDISNIMNQFITTLSDLSNGIDKDFDDAIGGKGKSSGAKSIAKSILIGNKQANWKGIVGLLNDPNYKYSKPKYDKILADAGTKGSLKAKQDAAFTFFDSFQKDITTQLNTELTEEEMKRIYDDAMKTSGQKVATLDYTKLKEFYDSKTKVLYKRDGYEDNKTIDEQKDKVGAKVMTSLDDKGNVGFKGDDGVDFKKKYEDILGPATTEEEDIQKNLSTKLGKIKADKDKMAKIDKFVDIVDDPKNADKLRDIEKIIGENNHE